MIREEKMTIDVPNCLYRHDGSMTLGVHNDLYNYWKPATEATAEPPEHIVDELNSGRVESDGHCMYAAIDVTTGHSVEALRKMAANEMSANRAYYELGENPETRLAKIAYAGKQKVLWSGDDEASALCIALGRRIIIHRQGHNTDDCSLPIEAFVPVETDVHIVICGDNVDLTGEGHFDPLA
jgi:hypothetical protein